MVLQRYTFPIFVTAAAASLLPLTSGCKSASAVWPFPSQSAALGDHAGRELAAESAVMDLPSSVPSAVVATSRTPPPAAKPLLNDDEAIAAQRICPVSGEPLGSMGEPIKVTVEGRDVFVCCAGCISALQEEPQEYLARLPR